MFVKKRISYKPLLGFQNYPQNIYSQCLILYLSSRHLNIDYKVYFLYIYCECKFIWWKKRGEVEEEDGKKHWMSHVVQKIYNTKGKITKKKKLKNIFVIFIYFVSCKYVLCAYIFVDFLKSLNFWCHVLKHFTYI